MMAMMAASTGCIIVASNIRYVIRPSEMTNVCADTKMRPTRTGRYQNTDKRRLPLKVTRFKTCDTRAPASEAETSHSPGGHGFVNTIFRLRLRRWEDMISEPIPAARISTNALRSESISRNELKLCTPEFMKIGGSDCP